MTPFQKYNLENHRAINTATVKASKHSSLRKPTSMFWVSFPSVSPSKYLINSLFASLWPPLMQSRILLYLGGGPKGVVLDCISSPLLTIMPYVKHFLPWYPLPSVWNKLSVLTLLSGFRSKIIFLSGCHHTSGLRSSVTPPPATICNACCLPRICELWSCSFTHWLIVCHSLMLEGDLHFYFDPLYQA